MEDRLTRTLVYGFVHSVQKHMLLDTISDVLSVVPIPIIELCFSYYFKPNYLFLWTSVKTDNKLHFVNLMNARESNVVYELTLETLTAADTHTHTHTHIHSNDDNADNKDSSDSKANTTTTSQPSLMLTNKSTDAFQDPYFDRYYDSKCIMRNISLPNSLIAQFPEQLSSNKLYSLLVRCGGTARSNSDKVDLCDAVILDMSSMNAITIKEEYRHNNSNRSVSDVRSSNDADGTTVTVTDTDTDNDLTTNTDTSATNPNPNPSQTKNSKSVVTFNAFHCYLPRLPSPLSSTTVAPLNFHSKSILSVGGFSSHNKVSSSILQMHIGIDSFSPWAQLSSTIDNSAVGLKEPRFGCGLCSFRNNQNDYLLIAGGRNSSYSDIDVCELIRMTDFSNVNASTNRSGSMAMGMNNNNNNTMLLNGIGIGIGIDNDNDTDFGGISISNEINIGTVNTKLETDSTSHTVLSMKEKRYKCACVALNNGRVVIAGGMGCRIEGLTVEIFDIPTQTFSIINKQLRTKHSYPCLWKDSSNPEIIYLCGSDTVYASKQKETIEFIDLRQSRLLESADVAMIKSLSDQWNEYCADSMNLFGMEQNGEVRCRGYLCL